MENKSDSFFASAFVALLSMERRLMNRIGEKPSFSSRFLEFFANFALVFEIKRVC